MDKTFLIRGVKVIDIYGFADRELTEEDDNKEIDYSSITRLWCSECCEAMHYPEKEEIKADVSDE